jgi:hypothetical protein
LAFRESYHAPTRGERLPRRPTTVGILVELGKTRRRDVQWKRSTIFFKILSINSLFPAFSFASSSAKMMTFARTSPWMSLMMNRTEKHKRETYTDDGVT